MKSVLTSFLCILLINAGCTQTSPYSRFINSFKLNTNEKIMEFGDIVKVNNPMTQEEALAFAYSGDSSRLYCLQKIINMETEKVESISNDLYLPNKCLRTHSKDFFLIAYSSYSCVDPNKQIEVTLTLKIVSKSYRAIDSLLVYRGTDYDFLITGLLNPKNGNIFLAGYLKNDGRKQACLYRVNEKLEFEVRYENEDFKGDSSNLIKTMEALGWAESF